MKALIDIESVARELAETDSVEQGKFFKAFASQLFHVCRNSFNCEQQVYFIQQELTEWELKCLGWSND